MPDPGWTRYLDRFHADRPGITEAVLTRSHDSGEDPYDWLVRAVPRTGLVLDVGCGSAPLWSRLSGRGSDWAYVGIDPVVAELRAARRSDAPVVRASATALPIATGAVPTVCCSMTLQVLTPLPAVLSELRRVLYPGGRLVATVPTTGGLRVADTAAMTGLLAALGTRLRYPNDEAKLAGLTAAAGLRIVEDDRRRFDYPLHGSADADRLLDSLYLPDVSESRYRAARHWLRTLVGHWTVPIPIRRIVAESTGANRRST